MWGAAQPFRVHPVSGHSATESHPWIHSTHESGRNGASSPAQPRRRVICRRHLPLRPEDMAYPRGWPFYFAPSRLRRLDCRLVRLILVAALVLTVLFVLQPTRPPP